MFSDLNGSANVTNNGTLNFIGQGLQQGVAFGGNVTQSANGMLNVIGASAAADGVDLTGSLVQNGSGAVNVIGTSYAADGVGLKGNLTQNGNGTLNISGTSVNARGVSQTANSSLIVSGHSVANVTGNSSNANGLDLSGSTLVNTSDVLNMSSNGVLTVEGGNSSNVTLGSGVGTAGANGWSSDGTVQYHGTAYAVYTSNLDPTAHVWVQTGLSAVTVH
jgi:hypothetical protein